MASRQTKFTAYTGLYVAIFVAALVVINVLADRNNKSWDTTANKRYSLSDQTEKVAKGLKADLKAIYFDRTSRFETAKALLDRYSNLSTKFKVEYVDPDKDPAKAKAFGARSYGTLILDSGNRREEAKAVTEQEITGAMVRLQQAGVILYRRGLISVLDRGGLEQRACECYAAVRREQGRLLAPTPGTKG